MMVSTSGTLIKTKVSSCKKISKPLMEKKRRARINTCLDQLKTLLEGFYSNNIRKRKFEKADILELTVKHLKHLQTTEKVFAVNTALTEYQAGFRSCMAAVHRYLLTSNANPAFRSNALGHLSNALLCLGARVPDSSTADSDAATPVVSTPTPRSDLQRFCQRAPKNTDRKRREISSKHKTSLKHAGAPSNVQQNYWRPW